MVVGQACTSLNSAFLVAAKVLPILVANLTLLTGVGIVAFLAAAAAAALYYATSQDKMNEETQRAIELNQKLSELEEKRGKKDIQEATSKGSSKKKLANLDALIAEQEKNKADYEAQIKTNAKEELEALERGTLPGEQAYPGHENFGMMDRYRRGNELRDQIATNDELQPRLDSTNKQLEALKKAREGVIAQRDRNFTSKESKKITSADWIAGGLAKAASAGADKVQGWGMNGIESLKKAGDHIKESNEKFRRDREAVIEDNLTPKQKLDRQMKHLDTLGLDPETLKRAQNKAKMQFAAENGEKGMKDINNRVGGSQALQKGSSDAQAAILAAVKEANGTGSIPSQTLKSTKDIAASTDESARVITDLYKYFKDQAQSLVVGKA